MAARKLQQEIDKEFKRVAEGVTLFESIYDKLTQSSNASQKEKLEDSLKKEIKKLQRSRDKIKGWASQNDIKDKKPLLDQRKLIETQMEKFKAVEKEMKTKAFSKEGLSAATKLDPKEKEKLEIENFLSDMVDELGQQKETREAEQETLQAGVKKGKKDTSKADRLAELDKVIERHNWHIGKLEVLMRSLANGSVEVEQVKDIEEGIKYYVEQNQEVDFIEDDALYDDLALEEEEDMYGIPNDNDKVSSQDTQSIADDLADTEISKTAISSTAKSKSASTPDVSSTTRRPSVQLKQPLPVLSSLQSTLTGASSTKAAEAMKPAPLPNIPTGQPLKYASAAAAAAASDKNGVGIAPLPPPPGLSKAPEAPASSATTTSATASNEAPLGKTTPVDLPAKPILSAVKEDARPLETSDPVISSLPPRPASVRSTPSIARSVPVTQEAVPVTKLPPPPSPDSGIAGLALSHGESAQHDEDDEEECIYHLPSSLNDLLESFEETKQRAKSDQPFDVNMLNTSRLTCPIPSDAEKPNHYKALHPHPFTPAHYPQEPLAIFDDPRLYRCVDTDSLFYSFYYRQGTYQQHLAAKTLKGQSWRFHKQYQTWFQRHEEPKNITDEFEQGTYRFFDYESTWMNRRKADFKFAYKFLEDDI